MPTTYPVVKSIRGAKALVEVCSNGEKQFLRVVRKGQTTQIYWQDRIAFDRVPELKGSMERVAFMVSKTGIVPLPLPAAPVAVTA